MYELESILERNAGSVLSGELMTGILMSFNRVMADSIYSTVPMRPVDAPTSGDPRLLLDDTPRVAKWVAEQIGFEGKWGSHVALGLLNNDRSELQAGVVLTDFTKTNAFIHVAFANRYALKRVFIRTVFEYAFNDLGLKRLTGFVEQDNTDALIFDQHIGFEVEHIVKDGNEKGDVYMLVLWRDKCRWIN